ncbi:endoplasmic reticulum metallopeptidase 1-like [Chenopodium quinoa]|uniref:endoplasmic reticulum metallopeptidase 1-like n=1 Tax=Chenopodium quinoa TaxID=63459 RepID=UPI000B78CA36|nr:endoplasmic reticulum metallopeptidase 1-like [Chenopodium quinoa]XP_021747404.1 endoplasmic reticulum metallopeptidase 1-like [Chenopodium quinoa]
MRKRNKRSSQEWKADGSNEVGSSSNAQEPSWDEAMPRLRSANRSSYVMLTLFALLVYISWSVYHYQYEVLPVPLSADKAGKRGFSEIEAMKHVKELTQLGPHSVGSDALDPALKYVLLAAEKIKNTSHWEVDVEVEEFYVKEGANHLNGGLFVGKTLIYADLNHIILRITPKYESEAKENSVLVSSHIDTVFSTGGAGDCSSCVAVMLELARGVSQWAHSFRSSVIFLFNTGEEEGLNGAHSFINQHPWSETVRVAIDLEAMGVGGKAGIFQAGTHPWAIEKFALVAKYPSGNIMAQDLFTSGIIKSATDFQVYQEAGLSGLDFAFTDNTAVYHTKNDKVELLKPGSLQHLGENMLAFLLHVASSTDLVKGNASRAPEHADQNSAIYFDILGSYMIVYSQQFANMLNNSVILQSLLIWFMSLFMGGYPAIVSFSLSILSVILMWIVSLSFSIGVAFILSSISWAAVPYIASPWLVIGLFGFPSLLGAFAGQNLGFLLLQKYLSNAYAQGKQTLLPSVQVNLARLEAERWLFKSGTMQWLIILVLAHYYKVGSSYIPLVWLIAPAFSYGLLEATLTPIRLPKPLKIVTLLISLSVPLLVSIGSIIRILGVLIGTAVRFDRNPGGVPEWLLNVIVSVVVAATVCLTLVYLLSYIHLSGAKKSIILVSFVCFGLSLAAVWSGVIPSYSEETARTVNVVHVVDTMGGHDNARDPTSYISFFSSTPGNLDREIEQINEGFECGRETAVDFVTFSVNYGCLSYNETEQGWSDLDIPKIEIKSDRKMDLRVTELSIDTGVSTRWSIAINTDEITNFEFRVSGDHKELVPMSNKSSIGGWHVIQFSGGKNAPTKFDLTLQWIKNSVRSTSHASPDAQKYLIKLRTDINRLTPKSERVLMKLPSWCSLFGKSTSPYTLAFLTALPIDF